MHTHFDKQSFLFTSVELIRKASLFFKFPYLTKVHDVVMLAEVVYHMLCEV